MALERDYPTLPQKLVYHCARLYGTRARELLGLAGTSRDLGRHFGGNFYEREASYPSRNGMGNERSRFSGSTHEAWPAHRAGSAGCVRSKHRQMMIPECTISGYGMARIGCETLVLLEGQ